MVSEGSTTLPEGFSFKCLNPCCGGRWSQSVIGNRVYYTNNGGCLNPCCGGRWSQRTKERIKLEKELLCLNPCCGGRWSQRCSSSAQTGECLLVLILVVVEDGLRVLDNNYRKCQEYIVLILVVVEDGLRADDQKNFCAVSNAS